MDLSLDVENALISRSGRSERVFEKGVFSSEVVMIKPLQNGRDKGKTYR